MLEALTQVFNILLIKFVTDSKFQASLRFLLPSKNAQIINNRHFW